jgi:hypothetical protein
MDGVITLVNGHGTFTAPAITVQQRLNWYAGFGDDAPQRARADFARRLGAPAFAYWDVPDTLSLSVMLVHAEQHS